MAPTVSTELSEIWKSESRSERFPVDREPKGPEEHLTEFRGSRKGLGDALVSRMKGPGGYYNIGNVLALTTGLGVQIAAISGGEQDLGAILEAARQYLIGSPGATALTAAIVIFFVSGEMYHRAWTHGFPPDRRMNRWGDFLSGIAAVVLTFALSAFGDVLLAAISGLLLAAGKFGSALVPEDYDPPDANPWPNRFRTLVLTSRAPALATLAIELIGLPGSDEASAASILMTAVMLCCYLIWARADLLLCNRPASLPARLPI